MVQHDQENDIGLLIKVWWGKDQLFYRGKILSYNPETQKHTIEYDDGDIKEYNLLVKELFHFSEAFEPILEPTPSMPLTHLPKGASNEVV